MTDNGEAWVRRADEVLARGCPWDHAICSEAIHFATSMLASLYGARSRQLEAFLSGQEMLAKTKPTMTDLLFSQCGHAHGAIRNVKAEIQAGLMVSTRILVAGEMLEGLSYKNGPVVLDAVAELVRLGKDGLEERSPEAKNVAAVLIAAAFEDLIRKMGEEFASVSGRPGLQDVITALKNAAVLKGGQVGTAQSYLQFRNDSLHADWDKVDRSQIQSCIGFVEELLMKHFS
jgi:hypothetical protein